MSRMVPWKDHARSLISSSYYYSGACWVSTILTPAASSVMIIYFHEVFDSAAHDFRRIVERLRSTYELVSLAEAVDTIETGRACRQAALTFDDGYRCLRRNAFPLLRELGIPATTFLPTDLCGRHPEWLGPAVAKDPDGLTVMTLEEAARERDELIAFQAHGASHDDLFAFSEEELDADFRRNKRVLEDALEEPVWAICYPRGQCDPTIKRVAARYFRVGIGSLVGPGQPPDLMEIRRIDLSSMPAPREMTLRVNGARRWQNWHLKRRAARRARELHEPGIHVS
jgi:peptidoglycan/xylan/chitin deacetylase (PgdA/CDA1 family)